MELKRLEALYGQALTYVELHKADELKKARSTNVNTFKYMKSKEFLASYCWVVYASGFKVDIVEEKFPFLQSAFKEFDLETLSRMRSITQALKAVNHEGKATGFLEGAKNIHKEGFINFKKRLRKGGIDILCDLPYIGKITKKHLAKKIGFMDIAKDDVWLERVKEFVSAESVEEVTSYLSTKFNETQNVIDVVLWRYCADIGLSQSK
jgi:hypothetical protein